MAPTELRYVAERHLVGHAHGCTTAKRGHGKSTTRENPWAFPEGQGACHGRSGSDLFMLRCLLEMDLTENDLNRDRV